VPFGDFTVDVGMVDLISGLWALGIKTTDCCQGTDEDWRSGYISMEAEHFARFLETFEDDIEIARHARGRGKITDGRGENDQIVGVPVVYGWFSHLRESFDASFWHDGERWVVNIALRFPPSFVLALTEAVTRRASVAHGR
jgi:hypothetical protein